MKRPELGTREWRVHAEVGDGGRDGTDSCRQGLDSSLPHSRRQGSRGLGSSRFGLLHERGERRKVCGLDSADAITFEVEAPLTIVLLQQSE